jgi:Tfp pilus assembly protein PilF
LPSDLEKQIADRIAGLAPDARRAVYAEMRAGLQSEIRAAAPYMPVQTVIARRRELEDAIMLAERAAARADPPRPFLPALPKFISPEAAAPTQTEEPAPEMEPESEPEPAPDPAALSSPPPTAAVEELEVEDARSEPAEPDQVEGVQPEAIWEVQSPTPPGLPIEPSSALPIEPSPPSDRFSKIDLGVDRGEEIFRPALSTEGRRTFLLYTGVVALVICAVALGAVIVGWRLDEMRVRELPPTATPAAPVPASPASELIRGAGFQSAAQEAIREGNAFLSRREFDRAIAAFDDAIRLDPGAAEAFGNRAFANWSKGDTDAAIRDYGAAIDRDPTNSANRLNRAIAFNRAGEYQRAVDDLDRVLAAEPENAIALNSRCWARAVLAHLKEALADCNEALRLRPSDPDILDSRGFVYLRLGRLDRAIADYNAVLKLDQKHAGALYGRGLARIGRGDRAGGNEDVQAARAIDPDIVAIFTRYGIR